MNESFFDYIKEIDHAITHAGKFHADDVFSVALLHYINPNIKIQRVNRVPEDYTGLAFDIGFGPYDHHQEDKRVRENGVPYAAFGLLWDSLGADILGEEEAEKFDRRFIEPLDVNDNFGEEHIIARVISNFNPCWDSEEDSYEAFIKASEWALDILKAEFAQIEGRMRAKDLVEEAMAGAKDGIMILKRSMPWKKYVKDTDITFAIYPSNRGGYCAQAVPNDKDYRQLKCPFVKEWCGKTEEEIKVVSGIETATFCHNSGFLFSALTIEDCIKACELSLKKQAEGQGDVSETEDAEQKVFVNFSIYPVEEWPDKMKEKSDFYTVIKEVEFPDMTKRTYKGISFPEEGMDITTDPKEKKEEEFRSIVEESVDKIMENRPDAVYVDGDAVLCFAVVKRLQDKHVKVVTARRNQKGEFVRFASFQ